MGAFNLWLESGRKVDNMLLTFKRKMVRRQLVKEKRGGMIMKDLVEKYGERKGKGIAESSKAKGLWYWDPNLPGDEEFRH